MRNLTLSLDYYHHDLSYDRDQIILSFSMSSKYKQSSKVKTASLALKVIEFSLTRDFNSFFHITVVSFIAYSTLSIAKQILRQQPTISSVHSTNCFMTIR